ncbi:MAG: FtsQ-type POTRA domain-containing protein [Geodermatophilaceae bacterium]|nr:FtsQ-type POTRA domain-containing protein [Geodermatophilaceae bacterium]
MTAVILMLTLGLGWLVFFSSALGLSAIEVRGAKSLSVATVQDLLAIPEGTPLARVDLSAAETALENVAQIESANVTRDWPGTLVVELTERSAVAAVDVDGTTWLVDRFGVLFAQVSALPEGVVSLQVAGAGSDPRATAAAIEVLQALDPAIRALVVNIDASSPTGIELELTEGRTVIWGDSANSARKSQILAGLLAGGVVATVYDVSSETSVVLR